MKDLNAWAAAYLGDPDGLLSTEFTESTSVAMALVDTLMERGYDFAIVTMPSRNVVIVSMDGRKLSESDAPRDRMAQAIVEACRGAVGDDAGRQSEGRGQEADPAAA